MEPNELKQVIETLLFITDSPLPLAKLGAIVGEKDTDKLIGLVNELRQEIEARGSALQLAEIAGGYQLSTRPGFAPFVRKLYCERMTMRLSTAALETLSIIAYKQPLTRAEIEEIRGVEVIAALESLLDKRLIRVVGRKETVGRPLLYGTTPEFLRHFGLKGPEDLPPIDSFQPSAESNLTAEDGASGETARAPFPADAGGGGEGAVATAAEVSSEVVVDAQATIVEAQAQAESPAPENAETSVDEAPAKSIWPTDDDNS